MGGLPVKVELFAILKEEMSSQTVALQRMIEGVFASMDGAEVHPFRTFTETKNFFGKIVLGHAVLGAKLCYYLFCFH